MSVRLLVEESYRAPYGLVRFSRWLFLLIGIGALSYSGWIYTNQYIREREETGTFDRARESRTQDNPAPVSRPIQTPSAEPFRAKLMIARLHLTAMVEDGVTDETLRYAAGRIPGTALPGQLGNVGVAAHRDTLFRKLKGIKKHDLIVLSTVQKDYAYEVTSTTIVRPNDLSVLTPTLGKKTLTLVTCYPFYFIGAAPKRFIVHARQIAEIPGPAVDD
jgi:sortase A